MIKQLNSNTQCPLMRLGLLGQVGAEGPTGRRAWPGLLSWAAASSRVLRELSACICRCACCFLLPGVDSFQILCSDHIQIAQIDLLWCLL
jgi:hypothetical protein